MQAEDIANEGQQAISDVSSSKLEKKKASGKKKIVEIVGLKLVGDETFAVVIFEGTNRAKRVPLSTLKHGYTKDLLAFYESLLKPKRATKDEVQALAMEFQPTNN